MAIPSGYRKITSADVGKTFGKELEPILVFNNSIHPNGTGGGIVNGSLIEFLSGNKITLNEDKEFGVATSMYYNSELLYKQESIIGGEDLGFVITNLNLQNQKISAITPLCINNNSNLIYIKDKPTSKKVELLNKDIVIYPKTTTDNVVDTNGNKLDSILLGLKDIVSVVSLPIASENEYNKHLLYIFKNNLFYLSPNLNTYKYIKLAKDDGSLLKKVDIQYTEDGGEEIFYIGDNPEITSDRVLMFDGTYGVIRYGTLTGGPVDESGFPYEIATINLLDKKLDKVSNEEYVVYGTGRKDGASGQAPQRTIQYNQQPYGNGIVQRMSDGRVKGTTATEDNDLTNLKQVNTLLANAKAIVDVAELPTQNINENVIYRVNKKGSEGTPIPNSGFIEKIYLNKNANYNKILESLKSLNYWSKPDLGDVYPILIDEEEMSTITSHYADGGYYISFNFGDIILFADKISSQALSLNFVGWNEEILGDPQINWVIPTNSVATAGDDQIPIGVENYKLIDFISITPTFGKGDITSNYYVNKGNVWQELANTEYVNTKVEDYTKNYGVINIETSTSASGEIIVTTPITKEIYEEATKEKAKAVIKIEDITYIFNKVVSDNIQGYMMFSTSVASRYFVFFVAPNPEAPDEYFSVINEYELTIDAYSLASKIEGSTDVAVDVNETGDKLNVHLDTHFKETLATKDFLKNYMPKHTFKNDIFDAEFYNLLIATPDVNSGDLFVVHTQTETPQDAIAKGFPALEVGSIVYGYLDLGQLDSPLIVSTSMGSFKITDGSGALTCESLGGGFEPKAVTINQPASATNGNLSAEQLATLQENDLNYIVFNNEIFFLNDKTHTADTLTYSHVGYENGKHLVKTISITISTKAWVMNISEVGEEKPAITYVENLPAANEAEFKKHKLYQNGVNLKYIGESKVKNPSIINVASLPSRKKSTSAAAVGDNIYVFGGDNSDAIFKFDTITSKVTTLSATLPSRLSSTSAAAVGTNIYVFGGGGFQDADTILKFDTKTEKITTLAATLPSKRQQTSAASVGTDIYVFGGYYNKNDILKFDTNTQTIETLSAKLPMAKANTIAAAVGTDIYILGGGGRWDIYKFNTINKQISTLSARLPSGRDGASGAAIGTDIYVFGGQSHGKEIIKFNSITQEVTTLQLTLPSDKQYTSAALSNNNIYIFGGDGSNESSKDVLKFSQFNIGYGYKTLATSSDIDGVLEAKL